MPIAIQDASGTSIFIDPLTGQMVTPERMRAASVAAAQQAGADPAAFTRAIERTRGFDPSGWGESGDPLRMLLGEAQRLRSVYEQTGDWNAAVATYVQPQGTAGGGQPAPAANTWKPKAPIKDVRIFGNRVTVIYDDPTVNAAEDISLAQWEGHTGIKYDPKTGKPVPDDEEGEPSANTVYGQQQTTARQSQQIAAQQAEAERQRQFTQQQSGLSLAEQQRQFNEQFGADKAKFNIQQQFQEAVQKWNEARDSRDFAAQQFWAQRADYWKQRGDELERLRFNEDTRQWGAQFGEGQRQFEFGAKARGAESDIDRGKFLLGLGSRPATLGRYLYALQGLQTPQGIDFEPPTLPGFGPNFAYPTPAPREAVPAPQAAAPASAALPPAPQNPLAAVGATAPTTATVGQQTVRAALPAPQQVKTLDGGTAAVTNAPAGGVYAGSGPNGSIYQMPDGRMVTQGATGAYTPGAPAAAAPPAAATVDPRQAQYDKELALARSLGIDVSKIAKLADGGVITEPVFGIGGESGLPYLIGEEGDEYVVPKGKSVSDVKGKRKGQRSGAFATGGMLGYAPDRLRDSVFNPSGLRSLLSGSMLRPGIPNFPQYNYLTGQGQSLLPSAQRLATALPSEVGLYRGFLQDEAGVDPDDALTLAGRMAPQAGRLRTPRYAA